MTLLLLLAALDCPPLPVGPSPSPLVFTNQTCIRQTVAYSVGAHDRFGIGFDVSDSRTYQVQIATELTEPMAWQPYTVYRAPAGFTGRVFVEWWFPRSNWMVVGEKEVTAKFYRVMHD